MRICSPALMSKETYLMQHERFSTNRDLYIIHTTHALQLSTITLKNLSEVGSTKFIPRIRFIQPSCNWQSRILFLQTSSILTIAASILLNMEKYFPSTF